MDLLFRALATLAVLAGGAAINRLRGGGSAAFQSLPGHSRFWASGLMTVLALAALWDIAGGLAFGLAYLAWSLAPHGRWQTLGVLSRDAIGRAPTPLERGFERAFDTDFACLTARHALAVLPLAVAELIADRPAFALASTLFPVVATAGYALGRRLYETGRAVNPVAVGETITGAAFGALLIPI